MSKITTREVQVFVAGAMALWGFRVLIWLPSEFFVPTHNFFWFVRIVSSVITGLALPLGVAILVGRPRAIRLTQIYLWLFLVIGFIDMIGFLVPLGSKALRYIAAISPDMLVCIVLLWLLSSRRFRQTPNTALEPTPTAP